MVATIYNLTKSIHGTIVSTAANLDKYAKSGFFGGLNNVLNGINSGINKIDEALYGPKNFRPESAPAK